MINGDDLSRYCRRRNRGLGGLGRTIARPSTRSCGFDVPAPMARFARVFGPWPTIASRFYRWRKQGLWDRLLAEVQQEADAVGQVEWESITWTAPACGHISQKPGQKGGGRSGAGPFPGRVQNQSPSKRVFPKHGWLSYPKSTERVWPQRGSQG